MVEKSCQHYLFNFISFFSFFSIFLSFIFRSIFLRKRTTVKLLVPPQLLWILAPPLSTHLSSPLPQLLHGLCPNSMHRHCRNSFTPSTTTSSPPLPQLLAPPCLFLCIQPPQLLAQPPLQICLPLLPFRSFLIRYHHGCIIHHQFYQIYCQQQIRSFLLIFWLLNFYIYYAMKYMKILNICYNLIKIIVFLYKFFQLPEIIRRWITQKVIGTFRCFSDENFWQYMLS